MEDDLAKQSREADSAVCTCDSSSKELPEHILAKDSLMYDPKIYIVIEKVIGFFPFKMDLFILKFLTFQDIPIPIGL